MATRFSDLVDLLLVLLYDYEQYHLLKSMKVAPFLPLDLVAADLVDPVPRQWMTDAAKILETRGLVECIYTFGGGCRARITGHGRLEVEQNKVPLLTELQKERSKYLKGGDLPRPDETVEQERRPALEATKEIAAKLSGDKTIGDEDKKDMLFDLGIIDAQLKRREPNRPLLAAMLENLSRVPSVSDLVANLIKMLNP